MPTISVIVPVYKAEAYLAHCIDSILNQTFSDLEVILVDDGSPDGSGAICDAYAAREPRVSVIHQENQGQAAARNHALPLAKGEWICFVDSDDLIHPQMLQMLYDAAQKGSCGISMCQMLEAAELPETFFQPQKEDFRVLTMDEETWLRMHDADQYPAWVACAKLIRREYIEHHPFTPGRVYEDNGAVCWWLQEAKTMAMMEHQLYFYRGNPDSTTKKAYSLKRLDYLWALEEIMTFCTEESFTSLRQRFADRYVDAAISNCWLIRQELNRMDLVRQVRRDFRRVCKRFSLKLRDQQWEQMLDAMYPKLIRLYYPLRGAARRLTGRLHKGDNQ